METKADRILFEATRLFFALIGMWVVFSTAFMNIATTFFPEFYDSYHLGDSIYKLGKGEYCSIYIGDGMKNNTCIHGKPIIPRRLPDGSYTNETVLDTRHDENDIIVITKNKDTSHHKYYIISKPDIVFSYEPEKEKGVSEFTDSAAFIKACRERGITLRF